MEELAAGPDGNDDGDHAAGTQRFVVCQDPERTRTRTRTRRPRPGQVAHVQSLTAGLNGWRDRHRDEVGRLRTKPGLRTACAWPQQCNSAVDAAAVKRRPSDTT